MNEVRCVNYTEKRCIAKWSRTCITDCSCKLRFPSFHRTTLSHHRYSIMFAVLGDNFHQQNGHSNTFALLFIIDVAIL